MREKVNKSKSKSKQNNMDDKIDRNDRCLYWKPQKPQNIRLKRTE